MELTVDLLAAMSLAGVARELTEQSDVAATRQRVVDMGAKLVGCAGSALIRVGHGPRQTVLAAHDARLVTAEHEIAEEHSAGIAAQAWADGSAVSSHDLSTERRWPQYTSAVLARTAIRSALGYCLRSNGSDLGVLVLYAVEPGYFTESITGLAAVYAEHASIGLAHAACRAQAGNLQIALASNREIGVAVGILVAVHGVSAEVAFELINSRSQDRNVKLHEIAAQIVREHSPDPTPT